MFLLYYLWIVSTYIIYLNLNFINFFFLKFNKFNLIFKKPFKRLTYLEKLFLILFNRENWFTNSICCFSNFDKKIFKLRKNKYPIVSFFYAYNAQTKNLENFDTIKYIEIFESVNLLLSKTKPNSLWKKNFELYDLFIWNRIFYKKYFDFLNLIYNKNINYVNMIKFNFVFLFCVILRYQDVNMELYNLNYYNNWYDFLFVKKNNVKYYRITRIKLEKKMFYKFKKNRKINIKKIVSLYKKLYRFENKLIYVRNFFVNILIFGKFFKLYKNNFLKNLKFKSGLLKKLKLKLPIRFSDSSLNKYINTINLNNYSFFFLRKNRIFNKSRYSRNRQLYRTGVYWCLWLNIIIVYGLYFFFYRFTFNFGYFWLGVSLLMFSTIFSRICKYNFFNLFSLFKEFVSLYYWMGFLILNFLKNLKLLLKSHVKNSKILSLLYHKFNYTLYKFYFNYRKNLRFIYKKKDYGFVFIWENYRYIDNSFLRYKSILNWFVQLYKVLTY